MHAHFGLYWIKVYVPVSFFLCDCFLNKMLSCDGAGTINFAALNLLDLYPFPFWLILPSSSPKTRIYVFYFLFSILACFKILH